MKRTLNIVSFYASIAAMLLLAGCQKETAENDTPIIGPDGTFKTQISVELPFASVTSTSKSATGQATQTRATAEATATNVWILQFDMTDATGSLVRAEYTDKVSVGSNRLFVEAHLIPGNKMKLVLVANTHDTELFNKTNLPFGSVLTAIDNMTLPITATTGTGVPADGKGLLMTGCTDEIALGATTDPVLMTLKQTVAKIAVSYDLSKLPAGVTFTNLKMQLRRVPTVLSIPVPTTAPYPAAEVGNFKDYNVRTLPDGTTGQELWYMGPNMRGTGTATEPSEKTDKTAPTGQAPYCTYVELSGIYQASATATPTEVVYRLWLGENNIDDYNIAAGKLYDVKIIPVNASYFDSRIRTYSNGFDLSEAGSDGDNNGLTQWGTLDYSAQPANCYIAYGDKRTIVFDATKKPRTAMAGLEGQVAHQGYNSGTESGTSNYYTGGVYTAGAMNGKSLTDDIDRSYINKIEVVWQTAKNHGKAFTNGAGTANRNFTTIDLNGADADNAFIKKIVYDKLTGYAAVYTNGTGNALIAAYDTDSKILWSWHIWGTDTEPQASVDPGSEVNGAGKMFMDRNMGALSATATQPTEADAYKYFGLLYQWGRKEPFTGAGPQYTTTLGSDVNSIPTAIFDKTGKWIQTTGTQPTFGTTGGYTYNEGVASSTYILLNNPTAHYAGSSPNSASVITKNPNTWTPYNSGTPKSIYDPCPYGYRVPKNGSWDNWGTTYTGIWTQFAITGGLKMWNSWWSAAGYRSTTGVMLTYVGANAYYWSSSTISSYTAYYVDFYHNGEIRPNSQKYLSHSFSVRCVQE